MLRTLVSLLRFGTFHLVIFCCVCVWLCVGVFIMNVSEGRVRMCAGVGGCLCIGVRWWVYVYGGVRGIKK